MWNSSFTQAVSVLLDSTLLRYADSGTICFPCLNIFTSLLVDQFLEHQQLQGDNKSLFKIRPHTFSRQNFSPHVASLWNNEPKEKLEASPKGVFKVKLDNLLEVILMFSRPRHAPNAKSVTLALSRLCRKKEEHEVNFSVFSWICSWVPERLTCNFHSLCSALFLSLKAQKVKRFLSLFTTQAPFICCAHCLCDSPCYTAHAM